MHAQRGYFRNTRNVQKLYLLQIDFWNIQKKPPEIKEKETKIRLRTKECGALTITSNICKGLIYLYKPGIVQRVLPATTLHFILYSKLQSRGQFPE